MTSATGNSAMRKVTRGRTCRRGFTLLEVIVAMSIGMAVIGVAVLSLSGVQDENRLRRMATEIEGTVRSALAEAVFTQRPVRLALDGGFGGDGSVQVKRHGEAKFRAARRDEFWEFSPTGICEPVEVRVDCALGQIELAFDPLTGMARRRGVMVKGGGE